MDRLCELVYAEARKTSAWNERAAQRWIEWDRKIHAELQTILMDEPQSEPGMIAALSRRIPKQSQVYLGNSLPIREWDLAAVAKAQGFEIWASRGLNGIDGQVSTFLGFARPDTDNWAILGDLTALYDLPGPWILSQMKDISITIGIINNGGGKIFSRMFSQKEFQNQHPVRFKAWADLWGLEFESWDRVPQGMSTHPGHRMIEMVPQEEATQRFWKKYQELLQKR
jgi:2-succinyl-5-enolpyruvyl-6-hydroxy-3-cyclohexene-1-carboxylate synthase